MLHARPDRPVRFRFGAYELDLGAGELSMAGHTIDLPDLPFAVLSVLLEHHGRLVTREELRARLWPNAAASEFERGLEDAVAGLRRALDDVEGSAEFVETIPRRGYRFIGPVETLATPTPRPDIAGGGPGSAEPDVAPADNRYELFEKIGAGGMGEVYRARDARLDREVAVKFLPPWLKDDRHALHRLYREAHAAAALNHPNLLAVHDLVVLRGAPCIVFELLEGWTLRQMFAEGGRLALGDVFSYATQMLEGLVAAHEKGIVHRDLKPENVFVTDDGRVKILDFGLARLSRVPLAGDDVATTVATDAGEMLGTPAYMSPEQAEGAAVDCRSDLFSFGVLLYEMVAGERPFRGNAPAAIVSSILRDTPRPLTEVDPSLPRELARLVRRCLQKDRNLRFQNTRDLRNEFVEIAQEWQAGSLGPAPNPIPRAPKRARRWLFAGGGVVLLPAAVLVAWVAGAGSGVRARVAGAGPGGGALMEPPFAVTTAPGWEMQPAISPDGSVVAYVSNESGNTDLWTIGVSGGNRVQITNDAALEEKPSWYPDGGAIAFASNRDGTWAIWKVPAPLGGSSSLVVRNARAPAVSADGARIAFVRPDRDGCTRIHVAELSDVSSARRLVPDSPGPCREESAPAWSPDGTQVAYAGDRALWVASAAGGPARPVTNQREYDVEPVWAGEGTVLFSSFRKGAMALWEVSLSGRTPPERLTAGPGPERSPSLSRDGRRLAFSNFWENSDLVIRDLATGREETYGTNRNEISPHFSPDGQSVVFAVDRQAGSGTELRVQALSSGKPAGPAAQLTMDANSASGPQFSPDGRWIAYYRVLDGRRSIWAIRSSGGEPIRVGRPSGAGDSHDDETDPAWSPNDGRLAFVSSRAGRKEIWAARITDGRQVGEATRLTSGPGDKLFPTWSPDGRWVAFVIIGPEGEEVGMVAAGGAGQRLLTHGAGAAFVRWIPGTSSLAVAGTWQGSRLVVRRVELSGRPNLASPPLLEIGAPSDAPMFDMSRDGRQVAFVRSQWAGDIFVAALRPRTLNQR